MTDGISSVAPPRPTDQLLQALLDSAGEGIWGVDLEGRCTFINRAACAALNYTADELVGQNMHGMVHHHYPDGRPYPGSECIVYNVFRKGVSFTNQVDHLFRKDGSMFYAELSAQPISQDGKTRGAVVTFRDITQARLAEQALRRSEKLAAVGQLASSIAHEINNPLEAITNLLFLVRYAPTLEEAVDFAAQAESELSRVTDIVVQTLRFHRQHTDASLVQVCDLLPQTARMYQTRFRQRGITLHLKCRDTPPAMLFEGGLRQVLNNLIRNAFDALPEGGHLHLRLRPANSLAEGTPGLRITVADTGTGFLPAMREHLFEPFHTSKDATGTGLGLWVSKGIIDKHGGSITMRSRLAGVGRGPHGTLFSLWLPLHAQAQTPPAVEPARADSSG